MHRRDSDGEKKRVLMLISDTGGGHRASAAALAAMMRKLRPKDVDVKIVDIWTEFGAWPDNQMAKSYNFLCTHQFLWRFMYHTSPLYEHPWALITRLTCGASFKRCIGEYDPDLVISLHPLCQHLPLHLTRRFHSGVPFATVCTDLASAHGSWFVKGLDACFVASDEVRHIAERRGVDSTIIRQHGLPVREDFWQASKGKAKASPKQVSKLGLERDKAWIEDRTGDFCSLLALPSALKVPSCAFAASSAPCSSLAAAMESAVLIPSSRRPQTSLARTSQARRR